MQEMRKWNIKSKSVPDAWFTGYTTNYTDLSGPVIKTVQTPITPGDNQKIAQYIFKNLMAYVSKDMNTPDFTVPEQCPKG